MGLFGKKKSMADSMYLYTEEEATQYESFVEQEFGNYTSVIHEIVSPDIHLDIIPIPPSKDCPYYRLVTMGMGAYKMRVPRELRKHELDRAELMIFLPPTWNINSSKEEDYWPIRRLKEAARLPIQCDTWLAFGHTLSSDEENTPYADNTKFCSLMLLHGLNNKQEHPDLVLGKLGRINFYQLFPLYKEELEFTFTTDAEDLLKLMDEQDRIPVVNINRKNYEEVK